MEAELLLFSPILMIKNMVNGKTGIVPLTSGMDDEMREISKDPDVQQKLKFSFVGPKNTVKKNDFYLSLSTIKSMKA
ncbi:MULTISPECIES: hypothetical protein [Flavobacterium]|uniref:hypothetical protein n=1 Tax=Flavobacterium TaxID=237 RepID=UPI000DABC495|nr:MULTISPECIES: hypothetical protein [Flavobacterium]KAF2326686.1 hypothetical protein DM444_22660 [Flavobacterium ginsenosidimutans]